jgi:Ca2+-binding EF-hand superfamily protein
MAAPNGETLAKDKAVPYVVNYEMVDKDKDGKISPNRNLRRVVERAGFQKPDASTVNDMKGTKQ